MSKLNVKHVTLLSLIRQWAAARNLINGSSPDRQALKYSSEFGELGDAIVDGATSNNLEQARKAQDMIKDGIGDSIVVLTIMAAQMGFDIEDAIESSDCTVVDGYSFFLAAASFGKLADAILKGNTEVARDLIGATVVHIIDLADHLGLDFHDCLLAAYNDIKDRKGVMYNGAFIKSTDAMYPSVCKTLGLEA